MILTPQEMLTHARANNPRLRFALHRDNNRLGYHDGKRFVTFLALVRGQWAAVDAGHGITSEDTQAEEWFE